MSCCCNNNPCSCNTTCDATNEPLASALNNFIAAFFGSVTKTCVNGQVQWVLPCDLDEGIPGYPRVDGEGLACYFKRVFTLVLGVGLTENITIVQSVTYNETTGQLTQSSRTLGFTNGILTAVGGSVDTVITTAQACS